MEFMNFIITTFSRFLSVVTKGPYNSGSISGSKSTRTTLIFMTGSALDLVPIAFGYDLSRHYKISLM